MPMAPHMATAMATAYGTRSSTYVRTDGLTKKVVPLTRHIPLVDAREAQKAQLESEDRPCICTDRLPKCARNCLLRWF